MLRITAKDKRKSKAIGDLKSKQCFEYGEDVYQVIHKKENTQRRDGTVEAYKFSDACVVKFLVDKRVYPQTMELIHG